MNTNIRISLTDSTDTNSRYRNGTVVPESVLCTLLNQAGYHQQLSPNCDSEIGKRTGQYCQDIYAAIVITHSQQNHPNVESTEINWESIREFRDPVFGEHFYLPNLHLFEEHVGEDTPDDMFDSVEEQLHLESFLKQRPPDRDRTYVSDYETYH